MLNKVIDRMLLRCTPISCSSERVVPICTWNFLLFKKIFIKVWKLTLQSHIFQVFDYAIFPRGVISLFYIKKYGCHMFFFGKSLSSEGFQVDKVINCASCFSKDCLKVCD